jgi:hypothetical protein
VAPLHPWHCVSPALGSSTSPAHVALPYSCNQWLRCVRYIGLDFRNMGLGVRIRLSSGLWVHVIVIQCVRKVAVHLKVLVVIPTRRIVGPWTSLPTPLQVHSDFPNALFHNFFLVLMNLQNIFK